MKGILLVFIAASWFISRSQPTDPKSIDIVRDAWGVPHIFSKTDAGVAHGLAWANAEDDFKTIQQGFLAGKAMLGRYNGKGGATVDYIVHLLQCRELVDQRYELDTSPSYKALLQGYCNGINAYALAHPKEVLLKKLFPVIPQDMLTYSVLQLAISSGVDEALQQINAGTVPLAPWKPGGSNGYAFNSKITSDGNTYLAIALTMGAISGYNVVYADRYDTIYYLSNGKLPLRDPSYSWSSTLPGNTSKTLWTKFHPVSELPQLLQPPAGYLFNSNHSPFNATATQYNVPVKNYDPTMGYEVTDNNRSLRFMELIQTYSKINYEDFKKIKYDLRLPSRLGYHTNSDTLFILKETDSPEVSGLIRELVTWDRKATTDSKGAAVFSILYYKVAEEQKSGASYQSLSKSKALELLRYAKGYLQEHFGTTEVTLGQYQKLVRGDKAIPLPGIPDVISAMRSVPYKNGMVRGTQGESYIELVKFTPQGPQIETVNCYGASNKKGSEHFDDQMELFVQQKTKPMTLNKEQVYREAKRIYHPE